MGKLIQFYRDKYPANGKDGYYYDDIVNKWTDYDLEARHDFIQWLFPSRERSKYNKKAPVLTEKDIRQFKMNPTLKSKVINATVRMLYFYGYEIDIGTWNVRRVKSLLQKERGKTIGLYSSHNYARITRIMIFLNEIEMSFLSQIFFLAMCESMRSDKELQRRVVENGAIPIWMGTQPFLRKYMDGYDPERLTFSIDWDDDEENKDEWGENKDEWEEDEDEWEEDEDEWEEDEDSEEDVYYEDPWKSSSSDSDDSDDSDVEQDCVQFKGLKNTGNSCYMDSVLLALLALPNRIMTREILNKDVRNISESKTKWMTCSENTEQDYKRRHDIQEQLLRITLSMRKQDNVKKCSMLRAMIKKCPGPQEFHGRGQQDSGEFLAYIFSLFQVGIARKSESTYVTNDMGAHPDWLKVSTRADEHATPIISVPSHSILERREYMMNEFMVQVEDAVFTEENLYRFENRLYMRRRLVKRMEESLYMVFNIHRNHFYMRGNRMAQRKLRTQIVPVQRIRNLTLHAIVVHEGSDSGGHYTAYIKCKGVWFYYDDLPNTIRRVGTYDQMMNANPSVKTNGVQYFYC
jgi:hypothetical protein